MLRDIVTTTEIDFLLFMYKANRSCQDLCDQFSMGSNAVHVNIKRMADKGLVANATEGIYKSAMYHLTDAGRAVVDEMKSFLT